jgi:23S rRNA U2552 (ribose-2'-O)-methylase RlmE/FtsJ
MEAQEAEQAVAVTLVDNQFLVKEIKEEMQLHLQVDMVEVVVQDKLAKMQEMLRVDTMEMVVMV